MSKFFSVLVNICFLFSVIFIVPGCAKKAPVAPLVSEETKITTKEEVRPVFKSPPIEEETIGGTMEKMAETRGQKDLKVEEYPAVRAAVSPEKKFKSVSTLESVHFDFDKYSINPEDRFILNDHAAYLIKNSNTFLKIQGHCDERGTSDYNLALGERRANATKNYLISLGVNSSRISTISYGEEKPVCTVRNEGCWTRNRRAEFYVHAK